MSYLAKTGPDGPCDCGTFFLDCVGKFAPHQVHVAWSPLHRSTTPEVENIIAQTWAAETDCARQVGKNLFDGRLCRLLEFDCSGGQMSLTLGPVGFKEFLGTNLTHAYLRYTQGPEVLANALGVSAVVQTSDGFLMLGRRSQHVIYHAGRIHPLGGVVDAPSDGQLPDPFKAVVREIMEEANLSEDQIHPPLCLGLIRDKSIVQPELLFDVAVSADFCALRNSSRQAPDVYEHSELLPVRNHPAAVVSFIEQNYGDLTPLGTASLLLHGLHSWGSGWFATTRGYLRSVI